MTKNEDMKLEVVRGEGKKKREDFSYCKWAAGAWDAEYYANTPLHMKSRERTLRVIMNDVCWYSTLHRLKTDTRKMQRKLEGGRRSRPKKQEASDE